MMSNISCPVHGFSHLSFKNVSIASIHEAYTNIMMKFVVDGVILYGRLKSRVYTNLKNYQYAIEMCNECPDGFDKEVNDTFGCGKRRGVLVTDSAFFCKMNKHETLNVFSDKMLDEDSICCICPSSKLTTRPELTIGVKCIFQRTVFKRFVGICKWIGKINGIECIGAEMKNWVSDQGDGFCFGMKVFDCRPGHGVLFRCCDIETEKVSTEELEMNQNGFVDLKCVYNAKKTVAKPKELLQIGRRVELLSIENKTYEACCNKIIFGVIKWIGTLNNKSCVGIELDYQCEGGIDGVLSCSESFECEIGHGAVCLMKSVIFDYYIYSVSFTVNESFNIDCNMIHTEDWNQSIVVERDLKLNDYIYVYIEKSDRILDTKGVIKWCGCIKGVYVCILQMASDFPITAQQKIRNILSSSKEVSHIIVHTQYLFKYRTIKSYEKTKDDIMNFDMSKSTQFGTVKWRGLDHNGHLYYGFEKCSSSEDCSDGTFHGQQLFKCGAGLGTLISAKIIRGSMISKIDGSNESDESNISNIDFCNLMTLLITVANKGGISSKELLSMALAVDNKSITRHLLNDISPPINIFQYPEVVHQLLQWRLFDTLHRSLDSCPIHDDNSKQLLMVAAESLKYGDFVLFEKSMTKCTNKDVIMENGETFLTYIIKEKLNQTSIIRAIETYEFEVAKVNNENVSPVAIACGNMMMKVVDCILRCMTNQELKKRVCSICMDRDISTVFNCGHNSCKECSESINKCHICQEVISRRSVLYLN